MRIISAACAVLTVALAVAACGGSSSNPGPAANVQACKYFGAYERAEVSGAVLQSEKANGNAGPAAHSLATFLVTGGNANTAVGEPLRHDLARLLTASALGTTSQGYLDDDVKATKDCAAVQASNGARS